MSRWKRQLNRRHKRARGATTIHEVAAAEAAARSITTIHASRSQAEVAAARGVRIALPRTPLERPRVEIVTHKVAAFPADAARPRRPRSGGQKP